MTQARPRLAVITPSYNREAGVRRLYRSLVDQTEELDWIHVVVDDCSPTQPDYSDLTDADPRFIFLRNARNQGPLISRNRAIDVAVANGADLIAFIDDDDYAADTFFDYVKDIWTKHREVGWYISRCAFVGETAPEDRGFPPDGLYDWFDDMQLRRRFANDVTHVVSTRRLGSIRMAKTGRNQREWTMLAKLARSGGFYASDRVTKIVEYHDAGLTLRPRGIAPDFISCWNYVSKPLTYVINRPTSAVAWTVFAGQLARFPVRLLALAWRRVRPTRP
ncbi:MAG: glycosyltransferase family A protein [Caulobacter sp.]|nr:glycosyltransferase family A protein [Caulobacter sp.]